MPDFRLVADFQPTGDQPAAIDRLADGLATGLRHQTLLGATGTGKSLAEDEPVLVGREDEYGVVSWSVEPIGPLVDLELASRRVWRDDRGTEVAFNSADRDGMVVATVEPGTHETVTRRITSFSRHAAPSRLWRVTTSDGRAVTVTGDHNFVRANADGRLETVPTADLRPGDSLPLPGRLPAPVVPIRRYDVCPDLDTWPAYVEGPAGLGRDVPHVARNALARGHRAPLASIGSHGVALMERLGDTRIGGHRGTQTLPASRPLTTEFLSLLGMFVAEGHVADTYATLTPGPENVEVARGLLQACDVHFNERGRDELAITGRASTEMLRALCGSRAAEKHLPPFWPNLDDAALGTLLAAYFDGDGWVERRGAAVCAITKSRMLASELSYALLRFGIVARLARTWKRASGTAHAGEYYWQVSVRGGDDLRAFASAIGFLGPRKANQLAQVLQGVVGGNADCIPAMANPFVRRSRQAIGAFEREVAELAGISRTGLDLIENGRRALRRATARRIIAALDELAAARGQSNGIEFAAAMAALRRLVACRWATVAKVEEVAPSGPYVYDFSVEGAETFFAGHGGLVVHNTFSIASVIQKHQRPTLVLAHNKTLAAQLYSEFREFFPDNAVEYFVSYFDYYQPEAYLPRSDTYIEKDSSRNDEIDKLRHAATHALFERRDVIIVASVSCIYGLGAPVDYGATVLKLRTSGHYRRDAVLRHLVDLQFQRNDAQLGRARFRVRGDTLEVQPASEDRVMRVEFFGDEVERITEIDPLTGELLAERKDLTIYPATHFVTPGDKLMAALVDIEAEMEGRVGEMEAQGRVLEAARLRQRTTFDIEMMRELGYCSGVENYSRHLARRDAGSRPWTLLDYFPPDWLLVVDESHMSIPQVVGMYKNDRTRKEILVDFGFRLPSALDNRPLTFEEFEATIHQAIYMSATPGPFELERSQRLVEQLIRPTGIVDPEIRIRPTEGQIDDLLEEIRGRVDRGERALVTTLTKKMAEDLSDYLRELGVKVQYLHSEVDTLERVQILRDLRLGVYDVLVGINLLREGIDLPEVTLVAILDADKEGFLRSSWSLIQMMGRAARNIGGEVVMYADRMTESMRAAIDETNRRRTIQRAYNATHGIEPSSIVKEIHDINERLRAVASSTQVYVPGGPAGRFGPHDLSAGGREQVERLVAQLEADMKNASRQLEFERAAALRDEIQAIRLRVLEEDQSAIVGRAAEGAARVGRKDRTIEAVAPRRLAPSRPGAPARDPYARPRRVGEPAPQAPAYEVTSVAVLPADEEPGELLGSEGPGEPEAAKDAGLAHTVSDWLPGIRDEHEEDGGWQARWSERPTWDSTVTPNVIKRTGSRPSRRGGRRG